MFPLRMSIREYFELSLSWTIFVNDNLFYYESMHDSLKPYVR